MNISQGPHYIDDTLTFSVTTHDVSTGALTDADAVPAYRVYEDETGTAILTGNMAKLDDANTTGFYSEQVTLSAANGFEAGKSYNIYVSAAVDSVTGGTSGAFKVSGPLAANVTQISGDSTAADNLEAAADGTGYNLGNGSIVAASVTDKTGYSLATVGAFTTGAVQTNGSNSATAFETNLTETEDDHWVGSFLLLTSGSLSGQVRRVTAYNGTTKIITCSAFTDVPADGVTFALINR